MVPKYLSISVGYPKFPQLTPGDRGMLLAESSGKES